ncbi:olfactory receptor 14J1-like [Erythrolamprus reginae]|uniref:olfactory receptor 14J1-like n=1 Tax=Erythrolamprus reginae TaxID=121349 RepID=UPI00396CB467
MLNTTNILVFILVGFSENQEVQILYSSIFLIMYFFVLGGNLLIIFLILFNRCLHTPMYFFLINLSIGDLGGTSAIIPKSIVNTLMSSKWISYSECVTQLFFYLSFLSSNFFLLTVMAYDRYIAICHPLYFASIMNWSSCIQMAGGAWVVGFLHAALHTGYIFSMPFCSNIIDQFFCEVPQLIKLFCPGSYLSETWILIFSTGLEIGCLSFIILSYVRIFITVLRMPSTEKREKAFSTCIPHLIVVSLLVGSSLLAHLILPANSPSRVDKVFTTLYAVLPSLMNPIIYSMRNKDVKIAFRKLFG